MNIYVKRAKINQELTSELIYGRFYVSSEALTPRPVLYMHLPKVRISLIMMLLRINHLFLQFVSIPARMQPRPIAMPL